MTSTAGSWTGWQTSSSATRASTCARTRRRSSGCPKRRSAPRWSFQSTTQTQINLPFITADASGPKHLNISLTRAKFDELTRDLVERCRGPVEQALADAKLTADDIDEVILVGGSTRMPAVQELVRRLTRGKEPNMTVNPDEVVAIGAALQAGVLKGEVEDVRPARRDALVARTGNTGRRHDQGD